MTVASKKDKKMIFSVMPVLQSRYASSQSEYKEYTELLSDSGYVYLAKTGDSADVQITIDELKEWIKTFD